MRLNLMPGVSVPVTKAQQSDSVKVTLAKSPKPEVVKAPIIKILQSGNTKVTLIIDDKSNKKTSVPDVYQSTKKLNIDLRPKLSQPFPYKSNKIINIIAKSHDKYQGFVRSENNLGLLKDRSGTKRDYSANELLSKEARREASIRQYRQDKYTRENEARSDLLSNQVLDRQAKFEGLRASQSRKDMDGLLWYSPDKSARRENKAASLSDSSSGNADSSNTNQQAPISYPVPPPPKGHYAEYTGKFVRQETIYFRGKTGSMFEQTGESAKPHETGPKSLLKTKAACIIGMILAILFLFIFLVLR